MNILFIVESYYPKTSGVPIVVKYLAEGLSQKGHKVSVVTTSLKGEASEDIHNGVHIYRFRIYKNQLKRYVGEIDSYRNFVVSFQADVNIFECSECVTTDVLLPFLYKLKGKKIFHSHGFSGMLLSLFKWNVNLKYSLGHTYNSIRFKWYYFYYLKKYIKQFDVALCLSKVDSSRSWLTKYAKKVIILHNAVDNLFLLPTRRLINTPFCDIDKPYLLSVATYSKQKNQIGILREFYKIKSNCALVFIGPIKTEYYELLKKELLKLQQTSGQKKDVYLLSNIPRSEIPNIMGHASLYLVGSTFEEFSISIIEAMSKGVPFISTNVGNASILPGGVVINRIGEMHQQIDNLLQDQELYKKSSDAGRAFIEEYCRIDKAIELLERIIYNL